VFNLSAALIDRLVHHGHVLAFTGESYRLRNVFGIMELHRSAVKMSQQRLSKKA